MERLVVGKETLRTALEASCALVQNRSQILSEELFTELLPLPYSSLDDAHNEMAITLLQHILTPYL